MLEAGQTTSGPGEAGLAEESDHAKPHEAPRHAAAREEACSRPFAVPSAEKTEPLKPLLCGSASTGRGWAGGDWQIGRLADWQHGGRMNQARRQPGRGHRRPRAKDDVVSAIEALAAGASIVTARRLRRERAAACRATIFWPSETGIMAARSVVMIGSASLAVYSRRREWR